MVIEKRKFLLFISVIAVVGFLITFYFSILKIYERSEFEGNATIMLNETNIRKPPRFLPFEDQSRVPFYALPLSSVFLIIAIIPLSYYFISMEFEKRLEKKFDVISKIMEKNNSTSNSNSGKRDDKSIILKFLNTNERKVLEKLIENKGMALQAEISRTDNMTKLKAHRAIKDLERKGIIRIENYGKTNRIILSNDIKEIMFK